MNNLTQHLGYKYSTFLNWNAGKMVYGIANSNTVLWFLNVPTDILYYTQPYIPVYGFSDIKI